MFLAVLYLRHLSTGISSRAINGKPIILLLRKLRNYGRKLTILVETFIYIINYISKTENDLWTLQFFDYFLPDEFLYRLYHSNTFVFTPCFHRVFVDIIETKVSVNILILLFYICPPQVHRGTPISFDLQFFHEHRIQVFMFYIVWIFYIVSWFA